MNTEWALKELRAFVDASTLIPAYDGLGRDLKKDSDVVIGHAQIAEQILDRVLPGWRDGLPEDGWHPWEATRGVAQRAIVQLERTEEIRENLGDNAPLLDASRMHPWAWEAARSLWQSRHYREAVHGASRKVNAETQNKLNRRDISETELFQQAYSKDDPRPGQPRLRLPDDDGSKTAVSVRRGIMALAEGCYAALRNPASHAVLDELSEVEALEQLAAFSLLARFVERSEVKTAAP